MNLCLASKTVTGLGDHEVELLCDLAEGHESELHYDERRDLAWKKGRP